MHKLSGVICDKCRILITAISHVTGEQKLTDYHICERCNPHPEPIDLLDENPPIEKPKAKKKRSK